MKNNKAFTLIEIMIVVVIISVVAAIFIPLFESRQTGTPLFNAEYQAWCKLENRHDLTYKEWVLLYRRGLLQPHRR